MIRLVGLGAGGHAKVVIEILRLVGGYELVGLLDPEPGLRGSQLLGVRVIGDDSLLAELHEQGLSHAFIGLGSVGDGRPRRRLYEKARQHGFQIVRVVHPKATLSESVRIGNGVTIMAGAIINAGTTIGDNVVINTGAIVEHDCIIDDHVHIATGAHLASTVHVAEGAHVGLGASVIQCTRIGVNAIVGAGATVISDVPDNTVVVGVPAQALKKRRPHLR